jgi:hypothetical protein
MLAINGHRPLSDLHILLGLLLAGESDRDGGVEPHSEIVKQQPAEVEAAHPVHEVVLSPRGTSLNDWHSRSVKRCSAVASHERLLPFSAKFWRYFYPSKLCANHVSGMRVHYDPDQMLTLFRRK